MLLGTTPNVGSGSTGVMSSAAGALRAGAVVRSSNAAFGRDSGLSGHHELLSRCIDEEDELMGMSPDMPSMMRSPAAGFGDFMKQAQGGTAQVAQQSSLAAAAAASNEQVPTMTSTYLHSDGTAPQDT